MTAARARLALAAAAGLALLAGALLSFAGPAADRRHDRQRPELMLLTTLPIVFPERMMLDAAGSPVLEALEARYRVVPISTAGAGELGERRLLLMAQPQAQPAEALVELDRWVRRGGRVLLLADPALEWPSERPLGDRFRPPASFADTGLLGHWGLRLQPPLARGPASRTIGGVEIRSSSVGALVATGPPCTPEGSGLVARCRIGRGRATVIADSDFLNPDSVEGADAAANFDLLVDELERLGR